MGSSFSRAFVRGAVAVIQPRAPVRVGGEMMLLGVTVTMFIMVITAIAIAWER
jgi:hypothetical protein